jgi:hypothetical protein
LQQASSHPCFCSALWVDSFSRAGFFAAAYRVAPFELEDRNDADAQAVRSRTQVFVAAEDHNSRSERPLMGNNIVAGLGSQTKLKFLGN